MFGIKNNPSFTVHMIVANEDRWVWYAISSVLDYCRKIIIYDTGSQDNTVKIIESFKSDKIEFMQKGKVNKNQLTDLRQEQVEKTNTSWFMILDGDEVWSGKGLSEVLQLIKKDGGEKIGVVVKTGICIGDIYHFQNENAGRYVIGNKKGHYNIRFYKKIKGYHWSNPYPNEAYIDNDGISIQRKTDKLLYTDYLYWHMRHLQRSTRVKNRKFKLELGYKVNDSLLPKVFSIDRPSFVPPPEVKYSKKQKLLATLLTPLYWINRF